MTRRSLSCIAALLCLLGIIVAPVAAVASAREPAGSDSPDPGLKEELWAIHAEHRLETFDRNVETAGDTLAALDSYDYDTTELSGILDSIRGVRGALSAALVARDRDALSDVNFELRQLWRDYRHELRQLLKGE
jgi:hypothetical protein